MLKIPRQERSRVKDRSSYRSVHLELESCMDKHASRSPKITTISSVVDGSKMWELVTNFLFVFSYDVA